MYGHISRGETRNQLLEMAFTPTGIHGLRSLFKCIFCVSATDISTISLTFDYAAIVGHIYSSFGSHIFTAPLLSIVFCTAN
jgi:hypothetical protein